MKAQKAETHNVLLDLIGPRDIVRDCPPSSDKLPRPGAEFKDQAARYVQRLTKTRPQTKTGSTPRRATLRRNPYSFVCLDVGGWYGNKRCFGLVCKSCVWLCKFRHNEVQQSLPYEVESAAPSLLKDIWRAFTDTSIGRQPFEGHGFEVDYWTEITGQAPKRDVVYLILPDMHLPGLPHYEEFHRMSNEEQRQLRSDGQKALDGHYVSIKRKEQISRHSEYSRARDADIFKDAGASLQAFLEIFLKLAQGRLKGKLKIIHIGDMYELWQGMGEWGSYFDGSPQGLILERGAVTKLMDRIKKIESQNAGCLSQLNRFDALNVTTHLYGNHDVYLIDALLNKNKDWKSAWGKRQPRKAYYHDDNIFAEHGHRMDDFNQDGKWHGPFITDLVYYLPFLRAMDPDRRTQYHLLAAIELYYQKKFLNKPGFSLFVMGHTHEPDLVVIDIYRKPGSIPNSFCLECHKGSDLYRKYKRR